MTTPPSIPQTSASGTAAHPSFVFGQPLPAFPPAWLDAFTGEQLERLAIRTVDGGLGDDAALEAEGLGWML